VGSSLNRRVVVVVHSFFSLQGAVWKVNLLPRLACGLLITLMAFLLNPGDLNRYLKIVVGIMASTLYQMLCTDTSLLTCTLQKIV
jgi:hypothetical protein